MSNRRPVVLGSGKKLFADGSAPHSFRLTGARVRRNGLIVAHDERGGESKVADTALDSPSPRELARRERMKRGLRSPDVGSVASVAGFVARPPGFVAPPCRRWVRARRMTGRRTT